MNYNLEITEREFNCTRPLYMSDTFRMVSANVPAPLPHITDIWKALKLNVWASILLFLTIIMICHKTSVTKKSQNNKSIFNYLWIYAKPMLGVGDESETARNIFYILWLFLLLPSIEIVRNELFTKMVSRHPINVNTIDDLLDGRVIYLTDHYKRGDWKDVALQIKDNTFKEKFEKFLKTTKRFDDQDDLPFMLELKDKLEDPIAFRKALEGLVLVEDEYWLEFVSPILSRFVSTHQAKYSYIPVLWTPLCYGPQFKYPKEAEVM